MGLPVLQYNVGEHCLAQESFMGYGTISGVGQIEVWERQRKLKPMK